METRCNVLIFRRCPQTFVEPAEVAGLASERAVPEFDIVFQGLSVLEAFVDTSDASDLHVVFESVHGVTFRRIRPAQTQKNKTFDRRNMKIEKAY